MLTRRPVASHITSADAAFATLFADGPVAAWLPPGRGWWPRPRHVQPEQATARWATTRCPARGGSAPHLLPLSPSSKATKLQSPPTRYRASKTLRGRSRSRSTAARPAGSPALEPPSGRTMREAATPHAWPAAARPSPGLGTGCRSHWMPGGPLSALGAPPFCPSRPSSGRQLGYYPLWRWHRPYTPRRNPVTPGSQPKRSLSGWLAPILASGSAPPQWGRRFPCR